MVNFSFSIQESTENWNSTPKLSSPTDSWQTTWDNDDYDTGTGIAVDSGDNVIIAGTTGPSSSNSNNQIVLLKYNSSGDNLWNKTYDFGGSQGETKIVLDSSDNIFVVKKEIPSKVIKFDNMGNYQWNTTGDLGTITKVAAITIDTAGNLYVVGSSGSPVRDIFVVKFNSAGVKQWEYIYHDSNNILFGTNLALDSSNNILASGYAQSQELIILFKLSNSGNFLWDRTSDGRGNAIVSDSADNIYITGSRSVALLLIKYDSSGTVQWTRTQQISTFDVGYDIALDSMDNIYIALDTELAPNDPDVVKYDSSGNYQGYGASSEYVNPQYQHVESVIDRMRCIAIDSSDNVYLGGYDRTDAGDFYYDIKLVKNLVISIPSNSSGIPSYNIFIIVGGVSIISLILAYRQKKLI